MMMMVLLLIVGFRVFSGFQDLRVQGLGFGDYKVQGSGSSFGPLTASLGSKKHMPCMPCV